MCKKITIDETEAQTRAWFAELNKITFRNVMGYDIPAPSPVTTDKPAKGGMIISITESYARIKAMNAAMRAAIKAIQAAIDKKEDRGTK